MRSLSGAHPRPGRREFVRNPVTCIVVTVVLSVTFWAGLIWAAQRLYG
ncbi:MAG: hypothetical protein P4L73_18860 [Caulobacteraceae bacterium]|nr:hypothetical protein [Caulobacteraceae bacterium]